MHDISTTINEQLQDTQHDIDIEKGVLKSFLTERLASDDQVLSRLPSIVSQVVADSKDSEDETLVEEWCKAIVSSRTAEIKARVDTVYLNSLTDYIEDDLPESSDTELQEQKTALRAELEDLHSEIAAVTEMVVEHELRKPIIDKKERKEREKVQARSAWLKYVCIPCLVENQLTDQVLSTLEYMSKRLDTVGTYTKDLGGFQQALAHVNEAAVQRMPDSETAAVAPISRRATVGAKPAFSPVFKLKPTRTIDLPSVLQDALRHVNVSFDHDSLAGLQESLAEVQLERTSKLQHHYDSASASTQEVLAERLTKADNDLRSIMKPLYTHTPFQQVHLTNPRLEEELRKLDKELEEADEQLCAAEVNELSLSDSRVRAFVAKYRT